MTRLLPLPLLGMFLSGCATSYQSQGYTGEGYYESRTGENTFEVSFRGNRHTPRERVVDFSLLRSSEVTIENGFRYFIVSYSRNDLLYYTSGDRNQTLQFPRTINLIRCFKEKPEGPGDIFDAELVKKSLKQKYRVAD